MRVALVSREVYPLAGGGIGEYVTAAARLLAREAEVTILTTSVYEHVHAELVAQNDPRLPPKEVRIAFVDEPSGEELLGWYDLTQCYSARVLDRLRELYPDGDLDLVEFPDFLAEGCVTVQAAQALDPFLESTTVCVRIHTSAEVTETLNGYLHDELSRRALYAMERHALAHADRLIWPLGDVLGAYGRFYGPTKLAPPAKIGYPYVGPRVLATEDAAFATAAGDPLRLLYLGRLERRKGVRNLVDAARGLDRDDFRLTLVGGDTPTGPLGVSMLKLLELSVAEDERIELAAPTDRAGLANLIRSHDALVVPSLWECGPYVALEALHLNRPVAGTPVGGLTEIVQPGLTGWLADGTNTRAIAQLLETVLDGRDHLARIIRDGTLVQHAEALCDERRILDAYSQLASLRPRRARRAPRTSAQKDEPLVSVIVPYHRASRHVRETIASLRAQTYGRIEIVIVNDGSFEPADAVLAELAATPASSPLIVVTKANGGLGSARNFGIAQSRGRYVLPFDADDLMHPSFIERCVAVLKGRPDLAYVTSWSRYVTEEGEPRPGPLGYQPLGNGPELVEDENLAGSAEALFRRRIFDLGFRYSDELPSSEDWHLYRELRRAGHFGAVIPERLLLYRVRDESMLRQFGLPMRARVDREVEALLRRGAIRWQAA